ncbi:class I SAM-dependent methyltransferase [Nocardia sp. NPDC004604]|uniref:SAM-dependent methyltransferase n=1 Tax=Nocardia sp. NPDC004604 TaxID=3157013 RepID=UPI0033A8A70F
MTVGASDGSNDVANFCNGTGTVRPAGKPRGLWGGDPRNGYWRGVATSTLPDVATERLTDLMIAALDPTPGGRVLDIGCGVGKSATHLLTTSAMHVVGITISETRLDQARTRAAEAGVADRATVQHADAMRMPFSGDSFDAA